MKASFEQKNMLVNKSSPKLNHCHSGVRSGVVWNELIQKIKQTGGSLRTWNSRILKKYLGNGFSGAIQY